MSEEHRDKRRKEHAIRPAIGNLDRSRTALYIQKQPWIALKMHGVNVEESKHGNRK